MSKPTENRRRTLIVNKPLQGRLILGTAILPAIALAALAISTAVWCSHTMAEAAANDAELPDLRAVFYLVVGFELVASVYLMLHSLRLSHRVAGPAYRICKSLERIRSGDLAFSVQLRKGDHLTEIRDQLNLLLDWLNENPPAGCTTRTMAARGIVHTPTNAHEGSDGEHLKQLAQQAVTAATTAAAMAETEIARTTLADEDAS